MMVFGYGSGEARYRDQTENQAQMPGVTWASFRCCECKKNGGTKGRQRTATGWRCEACKVARDVRLSGGAA